MIAYGIGGLGVDERVFSNLSLSIQFISLPWIKPKSKESITQYARRFSEQIETKHQFILIGVSFGGILAIELTKYVKAEKLILISSAINQKQIPVLFRLAGKSGIFKILPGFLLKPPTFILYYLFGISDSKHRKLLKEIIKDTDSQFLKWALYRIAHWKNSTLPDHVLQIHGSDDRLLNFPKQGNRLTIANSGHFIIVQKGQEINKVIKGFR